MDPQRILSLRVHDARGMWPLTFEDCVEVVETTPLEPGSQSVKRYCPELGLVVDDAAKLVEFEIAGFDD